MREKVSSFKKRRLVFLCFFIGIASFITGAISINENNNENSVVCEGVYLDNINLSNLEKEDLVNILEKHYNEKLVNNKITLNYGEINQEINATDIGQYYDLEQIANEIMDIGKNKNKFENFIDKVYIKMNKKALSFDGEFNNETLDEYIENIALLIDKEKQNPRASFVEDTIIVNDSENGLKVNKEELRKAIIENLNNDELNETVEIPVDVTKVSLDEDIFKNMSILGTYETNLPDLTSGRTANIRLFSEKINGVILMPDEILSVDEQGGSRELSDGYTAAPGYVNNQVVQIVAGGICQVVTTLYNSVLYSDLEIVERAPHSLPVTYVPLGRDATLAKGVIDFKFKNNYKNPIVIQAYVTDNCTVKTSIWGINENVNKTVEITAIQTGYKSSITYKNVYDCGNLVKSEILSEDRYN